MALHAHYESRSSDCDGTYDRSNVHRPTDGEDDYDFKYRVLSYVVSLSAEHGTLTVRDGNLEWVEQTDEGYSHVELEFCEDDCEDKSMFRDYTAEAAGY